MATVVLLGTLDTKPTEYAFLRDRIRASGCDVLVVDAGVLSQSPLADVGADAVAAAADARRTDLAAAGDRGKAMEAMTLGAARTVRRLFEDGLLDGLVGVGGSGAADLVSTAARALPFGVPKLVVTTMAAGDTRPYLGSTDVMLGYPVVDIAGLNHPTERVLSNAAAAIAGMARAAETFESMLPARPVVGATMYGNTTPCVTEARAVLETLGYEVVVFHAVGTGGQSLEAFIAAGQVTAVLDVTTTELADELVGGVCSAGPDRLRGAGRLGLPQVVSLGALDMVNFGPIDTVPARFRDRRLYRHTAAVTLMRTTPTECAELGRIVARRLNAATGPVSVFIPTRGLSMLGAPGGPFHDPVADAALIQEVKAELRPDIEVVEMATDINEPAFARAMAQRLDELHRSWVDTRAVAALVAT